MLSLPADIQSLVAQTIDAAESKTTGHIEYIKDKAEKLSVEQLKLCDFVREGLEGLDKSGFRYAQKLHDLSFDMKNILEALVQTHNSSTDAVLERISNDAVKVQDFQQTGFQALSKSTNESMDIILRSVLRQEAKTQAQSTRIYRKLEHISGLLESVERICTEAPNQPQSLHASGSNPTARAQALFASLWVVWKALDDAIRQFV